MVYYPIKSKYYLYIWNKKSIAIKLVKIYCTEGEFFFLDEHLFSSKVFTKTRSGGQNITEGEERLSIFGQQSNVKTISGAMHALVRERARRKSLLGQMKRFNVMQWEAQKEQFDAMRHWAQKDEYLNKLLRVSCETKFVVYTMRSDLSIKRITVSVSYVCVLPHKYLYSHVRKNVKKLSKNFVFIESKNELKINFRIWELVETFILVETYSVPITGFFGKKMRSVELEPDRIGFFYGHDREVNGVDALCCWRE